MDTILFGEEHSEENMVENFATSCEEITDTVPANYTGKLSAEDIAVAKAANIAEGIAELRNNGLVDLRATKQAQSLTIK